MKEMSMPDIFTYTDYRTYLDDYQKEARKKNPKFSHRFFARKAGISSSGLLSNIMKGRRNLSEALIRKFISALELSKKEENYFEALVRFNQSSSPEDRNKYYMRMMQLSPLKTTVLNRSRYAFFRKWWYSAIRELLNFYTFTGDYQQLALKLDPPISEPQAKEAVATLEELDMIRKDTDGIYRQTEHFITTGDNRERSLNIQNFQLATMDLARKSLLYHTRDVRHISTLTLTLSRESQQIARREIEDLQNRLLALAKRDQNVDTVFQINFQMFPLSRPEETP
jgi:uncharacterized protein (TIGR02147 family)